MTSTAQYQVTSAAGDKVASAAGQGCQCCTISGDQCCRVMVHAVCRGDWYTYRTQEGELEKVARFPVPEDKVSSAVFHSNLTNFYYGIHFLLLIQFEDEF